MKKFVSRRNLLKRLSAGMAGLIVAEQSFGHSLSKKETTAAFNPDRALIDPKDDIKITRLEIIPVNSLRTIFIKMHTDAGIIGLGEGTGKF